MVVKNLNSTFRLVCGCGDWLKHWRRFGKPTPGFAEGQKCAVVLCPNPLEVGAHVQKELLQGLRVLGMAGDRSWYVLPLCRACSLKRGASLVVEDGCGLAPASIDETCGRAPTGEWHPEGNPDSQKIFL